jgi:hypothetical protein
MKLASPVVFFSNRTKSFAVQNEFLISFQSLGYATGQLFVASVLTPFTVQNTMVNPTASELS